MAAPPARNLREPAAAAAATPSETETGEHRILTMIDAADFVENVQRVFEPEKYREFLRVANQVYSIDAVAVVDGMKVLLRGHPELRRQFNKFLPTEYKLREDDDQQPEEAPAVHRDS